MDAVVMEDGASNEANDSTVSALWKPFAQLLSLGFAVEYFFAGLLLATFSYNGMAIEQKVAWRMLCHHDGWPVLQACPCHCHLESQHGDIYREVYWLNFINSGISRGAPWLFLWYGIRGCLFYHTATKLIEHKPVYRYKHRELPGPQNPIRIELELELIQTQMTQKPMLRAEVYARALRASQNRKEVSVQKVLLRFDQ